MIIQPLTGKSTSKSSGVSSGGTIQPLTTTTTNNPGYKTSQTKTVTPIKQIQAPQGGFKIGDIVSNTVKAVQNIFKPISLPGGYSLDLISPTLTGITKNPVKKSTTPKENDFIQTTKQVKDIGIDPLSLKSDPKKAINDAWNSITSSVDEEKKRIDQLFKAKTKSGKVGSGLEALSGGVNVVFSPLNALFTGANDIPVLGTISKIIGVAFTALGEGATTVSNRIVDELPISKEAKDNIKPGLGEVFALAVQFSAGKILEPGERGKLIDKYGVKDAITIETQARKLAAIKESPLKIGENTPSEVIKHVINNDLTNTAEGHAMMRGAVEAQRQGMNVKIEELAQPEETKLSKVGKSIEAKAIEANLTKAFEKTADYNVKTFKRAAEETTKIVNSGIENAMDIAEGRKPMADGVTAGSLFSGIEEYAKQNPEEAPSILSRLANSDLTSETSVHAQELGSLRMREPDSATAKLAEIKRAREKNVKNISSKQKIAKSTLDENIKKVNLKKEDLVWDKFLSGIQC